MNKRIKAILFILIILSNAFFIFQNNVSAEYSGTGGTGAVNAGTIGGTANWNSSIFGYFISVYDQNHNQKGNRYDVTSNITGWIAKSSNKWQSDPTKLYDYLDIPYGNVSGNYATLLSKINTTLSIGDYITIEPYTMIDNQKYTFRGISDVDTNYGYYYSGTGKEEPFWNIYAKVAVLLAHAAKVGEDITVGGKTFTAPTNPCYMDNANADFWYIPWDPGYFCGYLLDKNIGYGITVVRYEDIFKDGKVKISIKIKDTEQLIKKKNAVFRIYDSSNNKVQDVTTASGIAEHTLTPGNYTITELTPPGLYQLASSKSVNISITANQVTEVDFFYNTSCDVDFEELGTNPSVESLINLYKSYPDDTKLLNFASPSCGKATCNKNVTLGCLSGNNTSNVTFNENNLSCYDEPITSGEDYIGFCSNYFNLVNNLGTSKFYGISGQFLIRQNNNVLTIYNENLDPVKINSQYIATAQNGKVCYVLSGKTANISSNIKTSDVCFGNVDEATGDSQTDLLDIVTVQNPVKQESKGKFTKYTYELTHNYKFLKEIYLEKSTGKYSSTKTTQTTQTPIYGIFSQFNSSSGSIPFELSYGGDTYTSNECKYETKKEIIKYDKTSSGNIELEFRTIDTSNPFVMRNTKTNWCDDTGDCKNNNSKVQAVIKERNNSYNQTGAGPKYKITLTPADIEIIRGYNTTEPYDNYLTDEVTYRGRKIIRNHFLYSLESGKLNNKNLSNKLYNVNYN